MTAQIDDVFRYHETEYSIAGISEGELFDPTLLDLRPVGTCSACWRGYQAVFADDESRLVLDTLHVSLTKGGPTINGVVPTGREEKYDWFDNHYSGLGYRLDYTGGLLLADGFIEELYVHMGFHPAWKYARVMELVFADGILQSESDRSERMADVRQQVLDSPGGPSRTTDDDIRAFIERSFDRTYDM